MRKYPSDISVSEEFVYGQKDGTQTTFKLLFIETTEPRSGNLPNRWYPLYNRYCIGQFRGIRPRMYLEVLL